MAAKKHGRRYPWKEWFARNVFTIHKGIHYNGRTETMIKQIRERAKLEGVKVTIRVTDDEASLTTIVTER